ncbi:putative sulfate exporter family transporter [Aliidiomarina sedimenti]|uniref:Sulfate exporter family transporter n=1 Tax=Aliidiomarina sedimenti TaxID=1933879 RepID=A0ABY0C0F3_9GAMM|nr:putative sulfate exporter family transporter [Aliidiomarina sedimenti]RUO30837.1 putative sulfate exporter family transporter [Aliidiomarina sedimenti]
MWKRLLFIVLLLACLHPQVHAAHALLLGLLVAFAGAAPVRLNTAKVSKTLLACSVVGLGFGVQMSTAVTLGRDYASLLIGSILLTLLVAWWVTRWLGVARKTGFLIGAGTAICGGSAIAAVAPAIRARSEQIAIALGCVFILNGLALIIFPVIGHWLALDPQTFGVWAAVAIHDTSSVVGAAQAFHPDSLAPATTLKLARAVFIVPLVLLSVWLFARQAPKARQTLSALPSFLPWFLVAVVLAQVVPQLQWLFEHLIWLAQQLLVVSIYLLGTSLQPAQLRQAGSRPLLLAVLLWLLVAVGSLMWLQAYSPAL